MSLFALSQKYSPVVLRLRGRFTELLNQMTEFVCQGHTQRIKQNIEQLKDFLAQNKYSTGLIDIGSQLLELYNYLLLF